MFVWWIDSCLNYRGRGRGRGRGLRLPMPMPCKHLHPHLTSPIVSSTHTSVRTVCSYGPIVPFESSVIGGSGVIATNLLWSYVIFSTYHSAVPAALLALTEELPGRVSPLRVGNVPDCTFSATVKTRATRANKHVPISAPPLHTESTHTNTERERQREMHSMQLYPVEQDGSHSVPHPPPSSVHSRSLNRLNKCPLISSRLLIQDRSQGPLPRTYVPEARKSATLATCCIHTSHQ